MNNICDLNQWEESIKGLYRYIISAGACYEIIITHHMHNSDILTAKANLYISGDWNCKGENFFERECLLDECTVKECIDKAFEDYKESVEE